MSLISIIKSSKFVDKIILIIVKKNPFNRLNPWLKKIRLIGYAELKVRQIRS